MGEIRYNGRSYSGLIQANGCFIDTNNVIVPETTYSGSASYTATQDCVVLFTIANADNNSGTVSLDGKTISIIYGSQINLLGDTIFVKKGQTVTFSTSFAQAVVSYTVYGIQQGSPITIIPDYASACYSTEEREIGCWTDGKPLYQKTFIYDTVQSYGSVVFSTGLTDVDEIASFEGVASYASSGVNNKWLPFVFSNDSNGIGTNNAILKINSFLKTTGEIYAYIGADYQSTYAINRIRITLRYTKTIDVAGSGNWTPLGKPTVHYSTEEQVIGTWIDGKPLYQITYSGLSLVCTNANQSYATNMDWGNIKKVVHSDIIDQYGQSCAGSVVYTGTPAKIAVYMQMANRTVTDITIQYTKTTD